MTQNWVMFFKNREYLSLALWDNFPQIKKLILILHI
jgi:hypothetical protein